MKSFASDLKKFRTRLFSYDINDLKRTIDELKEIKSQLDKMESLLGNEKDEKKLTELIGKLNFLQLFSKAPMYFMMAPLSYYTLERLTSQYEFKLKNFLNSSNEATEPFLISNEIEATKSRLEELARLRNNPRMERWHNPALVAYSQYLEFLTNKLKVPDPSKAHSFSWTGSPDQLRRLFDELTENRFIYRKPDFKAFEQVFSSNLTSCNPIHWIDSNKLLAFLFSQMNSGNNPLILSREWQSIIGKYRLFKNKSGKYLTSQDLASALNSINDPLHGLNPKGSEKINEILQNIKTLRS